MSGRKPSRRSLRPEEVALWDKVSKGFKRLDKPRSAKPIRPGFNDDQGPVEKTSVEKTAQLPTRSENRDRPVPMRTGKSPADRSPVDRSKDKKIRRGHVHIDARIDLHGMTSAKARGALLRFLARAHGDGCQTVLVITGKGAGSRAVDERRFEPWNPEIRPLPGVLRRSFALWLREPEFAQIVSGYSSAHQRHGGSGAFYVMLKRAI